MDEPSLDFKGVTLSPQKEAVRVFYEELWDHADKSLIPRIFHVGFTFRGSLGPTLVGHEQFAGYVDWVTGAFGQYTTDILAMIEEGNRVAGRCGSTASIARNYSECHRAADTFGGRACRSSPSRAPRCATCSYSANVHGLISRLRD